MHETLTRVPIFRKGAIMRLRQVIYLLAALLTGALFSESAFADRGHSGHFSGGHFSGGHFRGGHFAGHNFHGHARFGVFIGGPGYWPGYYPGPYYDSYYGSYYGYPPVIAVPAAPPTYLEQGEAGDEPAEGSYWHYCAASKTYYPYVKQCPGGWQRVPVQPPSER